VARMGEERNHLEDQGVDGNMGSEWILGRLAWGCGLDSTGSGQGPVAGRCECGDEPSGSCATELAVLLLRCECEGDVISHIIIVGFLLAAASSSGVNPYETRL
jgi:hypothetical protein